MECSFKILFIECDFYQGRDVFGGLQERECGLSHRFPVSKLQSEFTHFLVLWEPWSPMENEFGHLKCGSNLVSRQVVVFQPFCNSGVCFLLSLCIHHAFNGGILPMLDKEV